MKPQTLSLMLLVLLCMAMVPVQAQTLTIVNPGDIAERDVNVYFVNASTGQMDMLGRFNTTSVIETDGNISYTLALAPIHTNPFDDPLEALNNAFAYVETNFAPIAIVVTLMGIFFMGRR